jgi:hypothetical protein
MPDLVTTRSSLHAVAEMLLAGPQYRRSGTIRLRPLSGGFGTVADPDVRVEGSTLIFGGARVPLSGTTIRDLSASVALEAEAPTIYHDGSGADLDTPVDVDPEAASTLADCYAWGDAALRRLEPTSMPVLWPEHFDISITSADVNYGVSLGDDFLNEPYAYVGPPTTRVGDFWNAPFGSARALSELTSGYEAILEYFREGREHAAQD